MGLALAPAEKGVLVEETGGEHEDGWMAAVVGQQCSCVAFLQIFTVAVIETLQ